MRVISGIYKRRRFDVPNSFKARPTTDFAKENLFNVLCNNYIDFEDGVTALDLFAGTGQLGIECLSRGAESCTFVDQRRDAIKLIHENLKVTDLADGARVVQGDALSFLSTTREKYHLIFLDPPYDSGLLDLALKKLSAIDILAENGIIVCESRTEQPMPELEGGLVKSRDYRYGKIKVNLYRKEG
jgi:16S rRNA (guanine(966)-N(2))-methyltransferase RsmD